MKKLFYLLSSILATWLMFLIIRRWQPYNQVSDYPSVLRITNFRSGDAESSIPTPEAGGARPAPHTEHFQTDIENRYFQGVISKNQAVEETMLQRNHQSLDLYGRVVDQNGQPVVGAHVEGSVLLVVDITHSGGQLHSAQTDADGRFSFTGLHGVELGIGLQKPGYLYDSRLSPPTGVNYLPNPRTPLIFVMWKVKGAETMLHGKIYSRVPYDGTSKTLSLPGRPSDAGLKITLRRYPLKLKSGNDKYDWEVQIQIEGGQILRESDPYPYSAPEGGYQAVYGVSVKSNAVPWDVELKQRFYFKTPQGQFGRLLIDLATNSRRPDTGIEIESWLNPSGSRNLEFDPAKEVR